MVNFYFLTGIAARMTKRENALALCAVTIKGVALAETQSTANEAIGIQKSDVQTDHNFSSRKFHIRALI